MKYTIKNNITKVQRSMFIACGLLMCGLLTSCPSGSNVQIPPQLEENLPADATSSEPADSSLGETTSCIAPPPLSAPSSIQAADQAFQYYAMSGDTRTIKLDSPDRTVGDLIQAIKTKEGLDSCYCSLVCGEIVYTQDSIDPVEEILALATTSDESIQLIKISNTAKAKEMLGDNYIGEDAWKKLDIEVSSLPPLSDEMLAEAIRLQTKGEEPLLVLDLGKSIEDIERLCRAKGIKVLSTEYERDAKLRAESCYQATVKDFRWLLLPGSDHGVLPGSRNKRYADQVKYMESNYPGYAVGGARELVTLAMLKHIQDGTVLFPNQPHTYGRCKEEYQTGAWEGRRVLLGNCSASGGLVVNICYGDGAYGYIGLFCLLVSF